MKPTPNKKEPVKARVMHHDPKTGHILNLTWTGTEPVFLIPATQEAYDAMVEQMARGMYANERRYESKKMTWETTWQAVRDAYLKDARAALASINITPPTK